MYPNGIRSIKSTLLAVHQHRTFRKRVTIMPTCQGYEGQESRQPGNSGCANKFVSSGRPTCHPCSLTFALAAKGATHVINLAFVSPSTGKLESDKSRKTPAVAVAEKKGKKKRNISKKVSPEKREGRERLCGPDCRLRPSLTPRQSTRPSLDIRGRKPD